MAQIIVLVVAGRIVVEADQIAILQREIQCDNKHTGPAILIGYPASVES
jgi:hypothetical protein